MIDKVKKAVEDREGLPLVIGVVGVMAIVGAVVQRRGSKAESPEPPAGYMTRKNLAQMQRMARQAGEATTDRTDFMPWGDDMVARAHENLRGVHSFVTYEAGRRDGRFQRYERG